MTTWCTIAPVVRYPPSGSGPTEVIPLAGGVVLAPLPEWIKNDYVLDVLSLPIRESICRFSTLALLVEYDADNLGDPDPAWDDKGQPHSRQERAAELIATANISMWLAKPSSLAYQVVFHFDRIGDPKSLRQAIPCSSLIALEDYEQADLIRQDFDRARALHAALLGLTRGSTLWTALRLTLQAVTDRTWALRFLLLWIALEALFGPDDGREITYRLSQRIAFFLGNDRSMAQRLYQKARSGYTWRSKLVHGNRLAKLDEPTSKELGSYTEEFVRRALKKILSDPQAIATFNGAGREQFLDELAFA